MARIIGTPFNDDDNDNDNDDDDDDGRNTMASEIIFDFVTPSNDEGNAGEETTYNYDLLRIGDLDQPVTVNWQVIANGDSPVTADDFVGGLLPSGQVTFAAGQTTPASFSFNVMGDLVVEATEQFLVSLTLAPGSPPGTTLLTPLTAGTVRNDDDDVLPPELSIAATNAMQDEGDSGTTAFTFTVTRTGDLSQSTSVNFATTPDVANPVDSADFDLLIAASVCMRLILIQPSPCSYLRE